MGARERNQEVTWRDKVKSRLSTVGAMKKCAACGGDEYHLEPASVAICNGCLEVALVVCKRCGLTRTHALEMLGVPDG
jgi:hypothetical protein